MSGASQLRLIAMPASLEKRANVWARSGSRAICTVKEGKASLNFRLDAAESMLNVSRWN